MNQTESQTKYDEPDVIANQLLHEFGTPRQVDPLGQIPEYLLDFCGHYLRFILAEADDMGLATLHALDLGCAGGRISFELANRFEHVTGVDYAAAFIDAAKKLAAGESLSLRAKVSGRTLREVLIQPDERWQMDRCAFHQDDALNFTRQQPDSSYDLISAANLLCRVPEPRALLAEMVTKLRSPGLLCLATPFSWFPQYSPEEAWIDGYPHAHSSAEHLAQVMRELGLELVAGRHLSMVIPEHSRKFQLCWPYCSVWVKKD